MRIDREAYQKWKEEEPMTSGLDGDDNHQRNLLTFVRSNSEQVKD